MTLHHPDGGWRRCAWCRVKLRIWQGFYCRGCKNRQNMGFTGTLIPYGSRYTAEPDGPPPKRVAA